MRKNEFLTDEEVEIEIKRLNESPDVLLARQERRIKYRRRQYLYELRCLEKRGKELSEKGYTYESLKTLDVELDGDK